MNIQISLKFNAVCAKLQRFGTDIYTWRKEWFVMVAVRLHNYVEVLLADVDIVLAVQRFSDVSTR